MNGTKRSKSTHTSPIQRSSRFRIYLHKKSRSVTGRLVTCCTKHIYMHIYDKTIESSNKIFILKRESTCHDNNLVVKFYYAKQQIVYEVSEHEGSLKMKINFPWSDVSAIRATFAEERSSTLYIEVLQLFLLF